MPSRWKITIERQKPTMEDYQGHRTPGAIELVGAETVEVFNFNKAFWQYEGLSEEEIAMRLAENSLGLEVTMEPLGTSYIIRTEKL